MGVGNFGANSSSSGGGGSSYGWANALVDFIGAGASMYAAHKQDKAQEKAANARNQALVDAQNAQTAMMDQANADALAANEKAMQRNQELAAPVGESATIDFTQRQEDTTGSSLDFLVPKVGKSQLSVGGRTSGLGV